VSLRDPKSVRGTPAAGRPPFGLGPIGRVSTIPEGASPVASPFFASDRPDAVSGGRVGIAIGRGIDPARTRAFGLPNLRRNVCPHFFVTGARGALPIQAPHLLKALVRQEAAVSRCQLRGGVHLEPGYVNDVCLSPRFNQCVFYEEDLSRR
jgi:hypothetical protein